jgi:sialic acid synthase SpsE
MESLRFIKNNINIIDAVELHSISFNEIPFIKKLAHINKPLILGIGGRKSEDIDFALEYLKRESAILDRVKILMFGFQSFPTNYEDINLRKIKLLKERYSEILGYADHTSYKDYKMGNELIKYSFLYGARVFEKHLVNEKGVKRIDFEAGIAYKEFLELRDEIESLLKILGTNDLSFLNDKEFIYREREKQLIVKRNLKNGSILTKENVGYKVSTERSDFKQKDYNIVLNKSLKVDMNKDDVLKSNYIDLLK